MDCDKDTAMSDEEGHFGSLGRGLLKQSGEYFATGQSKIQLQPNKPDDPFEAFDQQQCSAPKYAKQPGNMRKVSVSAEEILSSADSHSRQQRVDFLKSPIMEDIFHWCREGNSIQVRLWLDDTEHDMNQGSLNFEWTFWRISECLSNDLDDFFISQNHMINKPFLNVFL
uniref:Uncharacterized protein n=1 Tax=Phlebotomus papatasi TaxID=29031 RepID=A0A1B0CYV8_PHLPP